MIQITRNLARQLRAVFRRLAPRAMKTHVSFSAGGTRLRVRIHQTEILAEHHTPGSFPTDEIVLPLEALADFEGRHDSPVELEITEPKIVQARWDDSGVPQAKDYDTEEPGTLPDSPSLPESLSACEPGFLKALADASATAAKDNPRYAITHVQLRGSKKEIAATDGRHLLIQSGWSFPWSDDVLIPASPVYGCKELPHEEPAAIGKSDKHIILRVGPWTVYLPIGEGRFPTVDDVVPRQDRVKSRGRLHPDDCAYLAKVLPRLPGGDDDDAPITIDLNEQVYVRARGTGRVTEVVLARSQATDSPRRIALNRCYLARALQLGLTDIHVIDASTPILFKDEKRKYVVMPLDKTTAIPPSEDAVRLTSTGEKINNHVPRRTIVNETQTETNGNGSTSNDSPTAAPTNGAATTAPTNNGQVVRRKRTRLTGIAALVAEAEELKTTLRLAFGRAHQLVRSIKRQKKQSQIVQSTLKNLKELQSVER